MLIFSMRLIRNKVYISGQSMAHNRSAAAHTNKVQGEISGIAKWIRIKHCSCYCYRFSASLGNDIRGFPKADIL
ncbi:hypothetical protein VNO77_19505 [Canavalia gladiata]|uniref:Uncharacterized protein n=1 Tax=Canavalia gladiata TaxID=3824 RepID=A0AAN9QLG8_CANGL